MYLVFTYLNSSNVSTSIGTYVRTHPGNYRFNCTTNNDVYYNLPYKFTLYSTYLVGIWVRSFYGHNGYHVCLEFAWSWVRVPQLFTTPRKKTQIASLITFLKFQLRTNLLVMNRSLHGFHCRNET